LLESRAQAIDAQVHHLNVIKLRQWPRRRARECQRIHYRSMQGRILASNDHRAAGKKCRGHLLGNMPERGGPNRDQFILEEWDRLERRIFHQTQERHRRATRSAQGYFHFM
jgi:hypothetical protein